MRDGNTADAAAIELRPGLPGHWRYNPAGRVWWGVERERWDSYVVREYEDGEPLWLAPEWTTRTLDEAKELIASRARAWATMPGARAS